MSFDDRIQQWILIYNRWCVYSRESSSQYLTRNDQLDVMVEYNYWPPATPPSTTSLAEDGGKIGIEYLDRQGLRELVFMEAIAYKPKC